MDVHNAPGRNWVRGPRKPRPVRLSPSPSEALASLPPARELGAGDHDEPYSYVRPSSRWTFPFSELQYARLLALRSAVQAGERGERLPEEALPAPGR